MATQTVNYSPKEKTPPQDKVTCPPFLWLPTEWIQHHAVTNSGCALYPSTVLLSITGAETEIGAMALSTDGGSCVVWASSERWAGVGVWVGDITYRIRKDSLTGQELAAVTEKRQGITMLMAIDEAPATSQVYVLTATVDEPGHSVQQRKLVAINLRRSMVASVREG